MNKLAFPLVLLLTAGLTYLLNAPNPLGTENIPALGQLLSPFTGLWQNAAPETASSYKNKQLDGLKGKVDVQYDERLVPHIFAENLEDALFAQGYVTAQHRLWQMDISTRNAGGTLAEVMGERLVKRDKLQRRLGLRMSAERAVVSWQQGKDYYLLEAYVAGVNAYINSLSPKDYPIEFKLLGYEPTEWSTLRTALFVRAMAQTLNFGGQDVAASNSLAMFGQETFDFLFPEQNPKQSPVIPAEVKWAFDSLPAPIDTTTMIGQLRAEPYLPYMQEGVGSNNWTVAGSKTASGNPILCNDPHLALTLPSIWYEVQLHTPQLNTYGVSLPGLPGVIIGFNEQIAWGQTNVGQDVLDWYEMEWTDESKTAYKFDGEIRPAQRIVEEIYVKGQSEPVLDTVLHTHLGPVVYEDKNATKRDLAMCWISNHTPEPDEMQTFLRLNQADNYDEYNKALETYEYPAQNFAFAATDGDIALQVNGDFPVRAKGQGRFVQKGNISANTWQSYIPKAHIAQAKNPAQGFIASANQRSTDDSYPYHYVTSGFDDYRGRMANRELSKMQNITAKDMMDLQTNTRSIFPEEALPAMLGYLDRSKLSATQLGYIKLLEDWDYHFDKEKVAPALFWVWYEQLYDLLWDEVESKRESAKLLRVEDWKTIEMLEQHPLNIFWDNQTTSERETPEILVTQAFTKMTEMLQEELGQKGYNWQQYKGFSIPHMSRSLQPFGRHNLDVGGFRYALNSIRTSVAPSWRMIVELNDEIIAYGVYPGGQSGNPGSPYYANMVSHWAQGDYYELFFMKNDADDRQPILFTQTLSTL